MNNSKMLKFLNFMVIYSYASEKRSTDIIINQESFADFLDISARSVIRYLNTIKEQGFVNITGKVHLWSKKKRCQWASNVYQVDISGLNHYVAQHSGYDVLDNIEKELPKYFAFMSFVKESCEQRLVESMTVAEKEAYTEKTQKQEKKLEKKLNKLKKQNEKYLKMLEEVNNTVIPMSYLNNNRKRLINVLCLTRNPDHFTDSNRVHLLQKFFNTEEKIEEFDTNASIYRLTYALGNNQLADPNSDIYKMIFNECHFNIPWTEDFRSKFKTMIMPIYMRENSLKYRCLQYIKKKSWKRFISKQEKTEQAFYSYLEFALNMPIYDILSTVRDAMHRVFNLDKFYRADIFIFESNLHILMLKLFKDMGIKTINVYDGFYFVKGTMTKEIYNNVYAQATNLLLADT